MSTLTTNPTASRSGSFFGLIAARLSAWNERRMTRNALSHLSDRELEDIGLTRADIHEVVRRITR